MSSFFQNLQQRSHLILGLMSGTSCDGLDMALVRVNHFGPQTEIEFLAGWSAPYTSIQKKQLLEKIAGDMDACQMSQINFYLAQIWAEKITEFVNRLPDDQKKIDLIASHGQTIWHQPDPKHFIDRAVISTLQLGDPAVLAQLTGIPVIGDFRVADMALGGQGAPLIPYFDWVYFSKFRENMIVLNIGGISNLTYIKNNGDFSKLKAFDCGPGNMLIDRAMHILYDKPYDDDGRVARAGSLSAQLLDFIKQADPFVKLVPPKSTGREHYGEIFLKEILQHAEKLNLPKENIIHTISNYTAFAVFENYRLFIAPEKCAKLVIGGGGLKNSFIVEQLAGYFEGIPVVASEQYELDSDFKEAIGFAVLANETLMGRPSNVPQVSGATGRAVLGKICLP